MNLSREIVSSCLACSICKNGERWIFHCRNDHYRAAYWDKARPVVCVEKWAYSLEETQRTCRGYFSETVDLHMPLILTSGIDVDEISDLSWFDLREVAIGFAIAGIGYTNVEPVDTVLWSNLLTASCVSVSDMESTLKITKRLSLPRGRSCKDWLVGCFGLRTVASTMVLDCSRYCAASSLPRPRMDSAGFIKENFKDKRSDNITHLYWHQSQGQSSVYPYLRPATHSLQ